MRRVQKGKQGAAEVVVSVEDEQHQLRLQPQTKVLFKEKSKIFTPFWHHLAVL
jgi:hypothetical protein